MPPARSRRRLRLRRARLADLDGLERLEGHFPSDHLGRRHWRHLLTRAHADVWVVKDADDGVVGDAVVLYRRGAGTARMYSLVVHPEYRGRGIAKALLAAGEARARARGCRAMSLEVRRDNAGAQRLYHGRGYVAAGERPAYYEDGETALRLRKPLRAAAARRADPSSRIRPRS